MKQYLFTFAFFCLVGVLWAAPANNGYLPKDKPQGGRQGLGYEIIKLDCETKPPTIKEVNGQTITISYYDCGEKGKKFPKVSSNKGYLPRKNLSF